MFTTKSLEDYVHDMNKGYEDLTKKGQCRECGACCSDILPVTKSEIREIKRYVKLHNIKPKDYSFAVYALPNCQDRTCPFLDISKQDKKCMIYEVRPSICKDFVCNKTKTEMAADVGLSLEEDFYVVSMRKEIFKGRTT